MEIIIVENGSTDKTLEIAKSYEKNSFKVYVSEKGVSKAKNFGISKAAEKSDWVCTSRRRHYSQAKLFV